MAKQSVGQKQTVERVMHEFKHGELTSSQGGKVRSPRQAIAIALSEAGASDQQSPTQNRRLARTKRDERSGQTASAHRNETTTRAALYQQAARRGIVGRSRMSKAALQAALGKAE